VNALIDTYALINEAIMADPRLLLANAVAWLDPFWNSHLEEDEGEDTLGTALGITRRVYPQIYAQSVERLRAGETVAAVDQFICTAITEHGIPLDDSEYMAFGIPMTGLGVVLEAPDLYVHRPELIPILKLFGLHPDRAEPNRYSLDLPEGLYKVGEKVCESLMGQPGLHWKQVGYTLAWLFGCSGNSLVDYDDESLSEFQPLDWETEEIALAVDMFEEARGILDDAETGIVWLTAQPERMAILSENIQRIDQQLKKGKKRDHCIDLVWPPAGDSHDGTTVAGVEFLHLRRAAA
jgi:hypothetical protein